MRISIQSLHTRRFTIPILLLCCLIAFIATGCKRQPQKTANNTTQTQNHSVVVTIYPLYDLAQQLAGDTVPVTLLLDPGLSPHGYQPTPADAAALRDAQLLITNGGGVDAWVEPLWKKAHREDAETLRLLDLIEYDDAAHEDHEAHEEHDDDANHEHEADHEADHENETDQHAGHDHGHGSNPHQWLVPHVAGLYVKQLSQHLQQLAPDQADAIAERESELAARLTALDEQYRISLQQIPDRRMVTFHDSFTPLSEEYGLTVEATLFSIESEQVTIAAINEVQRVIEESGVRAVFIEPQFNAQAADRLTSLGITLRTLDPLGDPRRTGYEGYFELMQSNLQTVIEGLKANTPKETPPSM